MARWGSLLSRCDAGWAGAGAQSGRVVVLVDKSAKDVDSFDPPNLLEAGRRRLTVGGGHAEVEAAVCRAVL